LKNLWNKGTATARALDVNEIADMARFAMESYEKFQKMYEN
jgi:hypothetical protein